MRLFFCKQICSMEAELNSHKLAGGFRCAEGGGRALPLLGGRPEDGGSAPAPAPPLATPFSAGLCARAPLKRALCL